jgi:hypothetical protein
MDDTNVLKSTKISFIVSEFGTCFKYYRSYTRAIRNAAFTNKLKELSIAIKSNLIDDSESLIKLLQLYAKFKNLDQEDVYTCCISLFKDYYIMQYRVDDINETNILANGHYNPFIMFISSINEILRSINRQIDFIRSTYGIEESKDERYNKTTGNEVIRASYRYDYEQDMKLDDSILKDDNGKNICKKLNMFKSELLRNFDKTFGDNSPFAKLEMSKLLSR